MSSRASHSTKDASPATVAEVIAGLEAMERELAPADGVRRFNDLYLAMTRSIDAEARDGGFEDPESLSHLDVVFADRYFAAADAAKRDQPEPSAWAPLFAVRGHPGIAPIQFALAGCNAHINYDLSIALTESWKGLGAAPAVDSPQHRDYLKVNGILVQVEAKMKKEFDAGLVGVADEALGRLDDVVAMWSMERARDAAWTHAQVLWKLRELGELEQDYLTSLAKIVGLGSRGLLVPVL